MTKKKQTPAEKAAETRAKRAQEVTEALYKQQERVTAALALIQKMSEKAAKNEILGVIASDITPTEKLVKISEIETARVYTDAFRSAEIKSLSQAITDVFKNIFKIK